MSHRPGVWLLVAVLAALLGGCASAGQPNTNGLKWVQEQEQERRTLHAQGFTPYSKD